MPVPARPWAWLNADDPMISPVILLLVFVVCTVAGYFIIKHVPSLLHTPLMSGMNALSGVTIVGALAATAVAARAPTMVTPERAFMPDISGVCSRLGTCLMMK